MNRFQIKICGNNNTDNYKKLVNLSPNFFGFIFYNKSKRFVMDKTIFNISTNSKKVGVFVNESIQNIILNVAKYKLDVVQLHGNENSEFCKELIDTKQKYLLTDEKFIDFKIWKAIGINNKDDLKQLTSFQYIVDIFLFDSKSDNYGGTGKKFDWILLKNYNLSTPFFLSGGISLEDATILKNFDHEKCIGFDINSRFESEPGIKNIKEIKQFIDSINNQVE